MIEWIRGLDLRDGAQVLSCISKSHLMEEDAKQYLINKAHEAGWYVDEDLEGITELEYFIDCFLVVHHAQHHQIARSLKEAKQILWCIENYNAMIKTYKYHLVNHIVEKEVKPNSGPHLRFHVGNKYFELEKLNKHAVGFYPKYYGATNKTEEIYYSNREYGSTNLAKKEKEEILCIRNRGIITAEQLLC